MHGDVLDVRRFTRQDHERGDTTGWRFEAGWFVRMSGLQWAWFSKKEVQLEDRNGTELRLDDGSSTDGGCVQPTNDF